jgi:hypothetical protein
MALNCRRVGVIGTAAVAEVARLRQVEEVPVPEFAVAAQVELPGADAADGHADLVQVVAAVDCRLAAGGERPEPVGPQLLVGGDEFLEIGPFKGSGDGELFHPKRGDTAEADEVKELAAAGSGTATGLRARLWGFRCRVRLHGNLPWWPGGRRQLDLAS